MVKVRECRLFQTIEIFTRLLGDVYTMTLVRTTARVGLVGRYRSLRCGRAEKKEGHGEPQTRDPENGARQRVCVQGNVYTRVFVCLCVAGFYGPLNIHVHMNISQGGF